METDFKPMNTYKNKPCAWCDELSIDGAHVPGKFLIAVEERKKLKGQWTVIPACKKCNQEVKLDEEWFTIHFCSALYAFSEKAKDMFDGAVTKHLKKHQSLVKRYHQYLSLAEVVVSGKSQGVKTVINLSQEDWDRLRKTAEMYARGFYYKHLGSSAKGLKALNVYLNPERFNNLKHHFDGLQRVSLFPGVFEYAWNSVQETGEAVFYIIIYGKPSFFICLVTPERHSEGERQRIRKIILGEINPSKMPGIEILG